MPGFAAFLNNGAIEKGKAHVVLNIGGILGCVANGDIPRKEVPYFIAETIMHEVIHALEAWGRIEFSHRRINKLLKKYREATKK